MKLIDIISNNYRIISIVGMAKNAGKTVTLNYLIEEAIDEGITIGITSTGRDGESEDVVTSTEKPMIYVSEGTLIATTEECLALGDAKLEIIKVTDFKAALGTIIIGKVKDSGYVQIAGPNTNKEIKSVCEEMLRLGAEFTIIDGAIDRMSSAAPSISDGTILSTGAVISRQMSKVIEKTVHTLRLFGISEVIDNKAKEIIKDIIDNGKIAIIDNLYNVKYLEIKTALNGGSEIGSEIDENTLYIVFSGALVKKTVEDILKVSNKYKNIKFVVKDGTKIFINSKDYQIFIKRGVNIEVLNSIKTLAITINPYAPQGYYFEPKEFLKSMKTYIKDIPIIDVILGGE